MQNVILHVDLNSYFASAEQQDNPQWRGKPLGVCEHLGGILIAASIEAKRWGIGTGTPVWEARRLYPKIILTKTHPDRYRLYSSRLMAILSDYTGRVEQYSIDEAFMDITRVCNVARAPHVAEGSVHPLEEAVHIARHIKRRLKTEVGDWLLCSVGIAENKLLAKIASDMQKPDGLVVISGKKKSQGHAGVAASPFSCLVFSEEDLYERLSLTDIPGIGRRQQKRLNSLGIATLRDLRDYPESRLVASFGILGHHLHEMGNFRSSWKPKVDQEDDVQSVGHMYTLPKQYREKKYFVPVLYKLCEMVGRRLRRQGLEGSVLHVHIHDHNHVCYGKSSRLGYFLQDGRELFFESMRIFEEVCGASHGSQFKLVGVTVSGLAERSGQQSLFERDRRSGRVLQSLDAINDKYGDFTVCRVPVKLAGNVFQDSIGFGRIKENVRLANFRQG